jgi:hypothetical protein
LGNLWHKTYYGFVMSFVGGRKRDTANEEGHVSRHAANDTGNWQESLARQKALKIFEDLKNKIIYNMLVLPSPFTRLLNPSTTVRCELSLGRAFAPPPGTAGGIISPTPGMDWGICLDPCSTRSLVEPCPVSDQGWVCRASIGS